MDDVHLQREISIPVMAGNVLVEISYGPLAHGTQRWGSWRVFGSGGRIGMYTGVRIFFKPLSFVFKRQSKPL